MNCLGMFVVAWGGRSPIPGSVFSGSFYMASDLVALGYVHVSYAWGEA